MNYKYDTTITATKSDVEEAFNKWDVMRFVTDMNGELIASPSHKNGQCFITIRSDDLDDIAQFLFFTYFDEEPDGNMLHTIFGTWDPDDVSEEESKVIEKYDPDSIY